MDRSKKISGYQPIADGGPLWYRVVERTVAQHHVSCPLSCFSVYWSGCRGVFLLIPYWMIHSFISRSSGQQAGRKMNAGVCLESLFPSHVVVQLHLMCLFPYHVHAHQTYLYYVFSFCLNMTFTRQTGF